MNAERRPDEGAASQRAGQPRDSLEQPSVNHGDAPVSPYADAAQAYFDRGWNPLPVLEGGKGMVPKGYTGYAGLSVAAGDVTRWVRRYPDANIAPRLIDVIGLDVDAYDQKVGAATLRDLVAEHGELPPTLRVSSRFGEDYDGESGIRLFRLPEHLHDKQNQRGVVQRLGRHRGDPLRSPASNGVAISPPGHGGDLPMAGRTH